MILQYLQDESYSASFLTVQDETNVKLVEQQGQRAQLKRVRKAILEGDWTEVEKLFSKMATSLSSAQLKSFMYSIYRVQYLELIEGQEYQKAFTHLTKRLKPLESAAASDGEFKDLCYLLTCKAVQEVLREWEGVAAAREALAQQMFEAFEISEPHSSGGKLPPRRLVGLLRQAVAYQMEFAPHHPSSGAQLSSLLEDYSCPLLPNATHAVLNAHTCGAKCIEWVGQHVLASGGNDGAVSERSSKHAHTRLRGARCHCPPRSLSPSPSSRLEPLVP